MKKALVTGGSSGIGKAFATALAERGYSVTIIARNAEKLAVATKELPQKEGSTHRFIAADLASKEGRQAIMTELKATKYDMLVNDAGIGAGFGFEDVPLEKLLSMIELNCSALAALSHAFLSTAVAGDQLVNIGSIVSFIPYPGLPLYSATKAFVLSLSESLFSLYKSKGVHVLAVCPGPTNTDFFRVAGETAETAPAKESLGSPERVVAAALQALDAKRMFVLPGAKNRAMVFFSRFLPTRAVLWLAARW